MDRFEYAKKRIAEKASIRQIAKELQIGRSTIDYWIKNNFTTGYRSRTVSDEEIHSHCKLNPAVYAYILGCYLGDGHIVQMKRTQRLCLYSGTAHPTIIADQFNCLRKLFDGNVVHSGKHHSAKMQIIKVHNNHLDIYFPQHGAGKKHDRDVSLQPWQQEIIDKEPECFIKGLIDTDGSLFTRTSIKKNGEKSISQNYQFTNKSKDIIKMYTDIMDKLHIHYSHARKKNAVSNILTQDRINVQKIFDLYEKAEINLALDKH